MDNQPRNLYGVNPYSEPKGTASLIWRMDDQRPGSCAPYLPSGREIGDILEIG